MNKWWKYWTAPLPESTCSDCGKTIHSFGPGGPRHKCDVLDIIEKELRNMEKKHTPTRKAYDERKLPSFYFVVDHTVEDSVLYVVGDEYDTYNWNFSRLVGLIETGIIKEKDKSNGKN